MAKCTTCWTELGNKKTCWKCAQNAGAAAAAATAAPAAQMPADWNNVKYSIKESPALRSEFASALGITDKGHAKHGANFSGSQTRKEIVDNLLAPCRSWPASKWEEMRQKCVRLYGYDPDA